MESFPPRNIAETSTSRCHNCILPTSLPSIELNQEGLCGLCTDYMKRKMENQRSGSRREHEFASLVERVRRLKRPYDCLIPLSGGKDSTYALYLCDRVFKMKCLSVTFDNGYLSPHAMRNINNAVESSRADHMMIKVNRATMLDLYRLFLQKTGTFCPACLRGIGMALDVADKFKIPMTLSGTGWQVTYLAGIPEVYQEGLPAFFRKVVRGEPIEGEVRSLTAGTSSSKIARFFKIASRILRLPQLSRTHYIRLYDYFEPDYERIYDIIEKEMGWSAGTESSAEHLDCELHAVAGYVQHLKFPDLTPHTIHRAGLIRMGKIDRETALAQDKEERTSLSAPSGLDVFLKEIGISSAEFISLSSDWKTVNRFRTKKKNYLKSLYHKLTNQ